MTMETIRSGLSSTLYHITSIYNLANILQKDRFELKPVEGTDYEKEISKKASSYLSTSRSPTSDYFRRNASVHSVIIVLDGNLLGQKYSGGPVDYWGPTMNKDNDEMEDRVFSKTPFIPNATSYIKELHVLRDLEGNPKTYAKQIFSVYKQALLKKIPLFLYGFADEAWTKTNPSPGLFSSQPDWSNWNKSKPSNVAKQNFLLLNKKKADPKASVTELFKAIDWTTEPLSEYDKKYFRTKTSSDFAGWLQLYNMPLPSNLTTEKEKQSFLQSKLSKSASSLLYKVRYYRRDAVESLKTLIHNTRSTPYGRSDKEREMLDSLIGILRSKRWDTLGFLMFIEQKFKGWLT